MQTLIPKVFKDRLSTTDENGHRVRVIPALVKGRFQKIKNWVHLFLVGFFLILPWIKIGGQPAFLLDVPHRRFYLAGHLFLPQDVPGIFFVISSFAVLLVLLSSLFGRVWCGWGCPQTVFIEGFFRRVERWVEGNHLEQRALDKMSWGFEKIRKKGLKWGLFVAGTLVITHSFLAYFIGADEVLKIVLMSPAENPGSFLLVVIASAVILFDFGWFREQFCLIACPYGRFQSIMMDENSVTVAYDTKRGEPRKSTVAKGTPEGDCINCFKCVQVCPTGIDIRNGFQMECIACTACIDACDVVMEKTGRPKGLVRYDSLVGLAGGKTKLLRPRTILYVVLLGVLLSGLFYRIQAQKSFETEIIRAVDTPYQLIQGADGVRQVINHFKVNWYNVTASSVKARVLLPVASKELGFELIQAGETFEIPPGKKISHQFFVKGPVASLKSNEGRLSLEVEWQNHEVKTEAVEVMLMGPHADF
jgi:cytochrome c oxidase accessory protein FixG